MCSCGVCCYSVE
uniref:Uncharacterized protein n=1 Tax=Anguilla anguilla TaxID=7936 RepID=A0A0E9PGY5_ANGAN